jgi:hypothetical protein
VPRNRRQPGRSRNRRPAEPRPQQRAPRAGSSRRPGPAPAPQPGWRSTLERFSYPTLLALTRLPKWLLGLVTAAVLLGGLLAPAPWSPILLSVVVAFLTWLLVLAWPRLDSTPRIIRCAVIGALAAIVVAQIVGVL